MWEYLNDTLGFKVPVKITFDDVDTYDNQAGEAGAHLQHLAARLCYGAFNAKFRDKLCERIEAETGITWPIIGTKKVGDNEVKIFMNEGKYLNLVKNSDGAPSEEKLNEWAQEIAGGMEPVSAEKTERGKLSKQYLEVGQAYLNRINANPELGQKFKDNWTRDNKVSFEARFGAGELTAEVLGRAVKANEERKQREALAQVELLS